jgi:hypothetical protein
MNLCQLRLTSMQDQQKLLSNNQIEYFYHNDFVERQIEDFIKLTGTSLNNVSNILNPGVIVDLGGGCGFFANALKHHTDLKIRVVDIDAISISLCNQAGLEAAIGDALNPKIVGDELVTCFNLILHHLVGKSENETRKLQERALSAWHSNGNIIFINEYIYESFFIKNFSGWIIYQITSNAFLSSVGLLMAKIFPSLKANTLFVGVRFRSHKEWLMMFESLGFDVVDVVKGKQEDISLPRRFLLIKNCRRDSFLLKPRVT